MRDRTIWKDHVVSDTGYFYVKEVPEISEDDVYAIKPFGEVMQQGTMQDAEHFNSIEDSLDAHELAIGLLLNSVKIIAENGTGGGTEGADFIAFEFTVAADAWKDSGDENARYRYYTDVTNSVISASHYPSVTLDKNSLEVACNAGVASYADTPADGTLRLYSQVKPADAISGTCQLWSSGGGSGGGGGTYILPIASASVLGGIRTSDSIAVDPDGTAHSYADVSPDHISTDEDASEMLDDVFGPDGSGTAE